MKSKLIILSMVVLVFSASQVFAEGGHDHGGHGEAASEGKGSMMEHKGSEKGSMHEEHEESEEAHSDVIKVGNKICPVSGQSVDSMGKPYQVEHNGKLYNLCCKMCAKDFKKDPEKYSQIADEAMEAHEEEESEGHKGSHMEGKEDGHDHHH